MTAREVPGLMLGALRGDAVSLRRLLGARRSGRWAIGLGAGALASVSPSWSAAAIFTAFHLALALAVAIPRREAGGLRLDQEWLLAVWTTAPLLLVCAPLRFLGESNLAVLAAIVTGHLLVWRGLRRQDRLLSRSS